MQFGRGFNCLLSQERSNIQVNSLDRHTNIVGCQLGLLGFTSHLRHGLDSLQRILAVSGLTTQHQGIGPVIDGIGDIRHLGTGRARVIDHGVQHLCSHDHRLLHLYTFPDQHTLNARNLLSRHLDTQVTAGNHHTVSHFQNLIDPIDTLLVLNLGNDLDRAVVFVQNPLNIQHVLFVADKGVGNEVQIILDRPQDILAVLLRQRRQVNTYTRHIDTLAATDRGIILHFTHQVIRTLVNHSHFQITIINQNGTANRQVMHKVPIRDCNAIVGCFQIRVTHHLNPVSRLESNRLLACIDRCTDLRPFGIHQNTNPFRDGPRIGDNTAQPLSRQMGCVETNDIHASLVQRIDEINVATLV